MAEVETINEAAVGAAVGGGGGGAHMVCVLMPVVAGIVYIAVLCVVDKIGAAGG